MTTDAPRYELTPADDTRSASSAQEHYAAADHHATRSAYARSACNGQGAARHLATALCHSTVALILQGLPVSALETLTQLVRHISTLHVQTRYARRNGLSDAAIADREAATKHYQALQSALRRARKGGDLPVIVHYGLPAQPAPQITHVPALVNPVMTAHAQPQPAQAESIQADPALLSWTPDTSSPTNMLNSYALAYAALHLRESTGTDAHPDPYTRDLHARLLGAYRSLGFDGGKPHKGHASQRLAAARKAHPVLIEMGQLHKSASFIEAAISAGWAFPVPSLP